MVKVPTRICVIRHGETFWNADRRIQGHLDIGLNPTGLRQARAAARRLAAEAGTVTAVYSSDLARARVTAEAIAAHLGRPVCLRPALRERSYGIFEGLTYDEARQQHPGAYAAFEARQPELPIPQGESLEDFSARVSRCLEALAAEHRGETVVLVCHGGVLDVINRHVRGRPLAAPRDFTIPNAGITWLERDGAGWRIVQWSCTRHLEDGALDELPG